MISALRSAWFEVALRLLLAAGALALGLVILAPREQAPAAVQAEEVTP